MPVSNVKSQWVEGNLVFYDKAGNVMVTFDGTNRKLTIPSGAAIQLPTTQRTGRIDLPLASWRVADAAATNYGLVAATAAIGSGGVGGIDGAPRITRVNAATDTTARIAYGDAELKPILNDFTLPPDVDATAALTFKILCGMAGANNATSILTLTWVAVGPGAYAAGSDQGSATTAIASATLVTKSIAIAVAAINAPGNHVSVSLTPTSPGTDAMHIYGTYVEYTKLST